MSRFVPVESAPRATEAQCQATIVQAARLAGWMVHAERPAQKSNGRWVTAIQGEPGFPDLILLKGNRAIAVELKRRPNRVAPNQQRWLEAFSAAGVMALVVFVPEGIGLLLTELTRPA